MPIPKQLLVQELDAKSSVTTCNSPYCSPRPPCDENQICCPIDYVSGVDTAGYTSGNLCVGFTNCNPPSSVKENSPCTDGCNDGIDNDRDGNKDWDSLGTRGPEKGDNNCPISVTAISVNQNPVCPGTQFTLTCTSSVANVNSIVGSVDGGTACSSTGVWNGKSTTFTCTAPSTIGSFTVRCSVDTSKSYQSGSDKTKSMTAGGSNCCSSYSTSTCTSDPNCKICNQCSGKKYSGGNTRCIRKIDACNTYCDAGQCGATCDDTDTPCQNYCSGNTLYYNAACGTTTCSCTYSSMNCNTQDGWYDTTNLRWVSSGQCTEKEQKEQKYRDYSCSTSSCTFTVTSTRWVDTGNTRNKADGTSCNDGKYCTINDACSGGTCISSTNRDCSSYTDACNTGSCDESQNTCKANPKPAGTPCGTGSCPATQCSGSDQITYSGDTTKYCDAQGTCTDPSCTSSTTDCTQANNQDGDAIACNCNCNGYDISEKPQNNNCNDGVDNDCDGNWDWDTADRGSVGNLPPKGDNGCKVGVTAANIVEASYCPGAAITVECTSTVPNVNSIDASLGSTPCNYVLWSGNKAIFTCPVPGTATGTLTATCSVDTQKSYAETGKQFATDTVTATPLSQCTLDQPTCQSQGGTWISEYCQGNKYYSPADPNGYCLLSGTPTYRCEADLNNDGDTSDAKCNAECDATSAPCPQTICDSFCVDQYTIRIREDKNNRCQISDCTCESNTCSGTSQSCGTTEIPNNRLHRNGVCDNTCNEPRGTRRDGTDATCVDCTTPTRYECMTNYHDINGPGDGSDSDGCEYSCTQSNNGIECCGDEIDNDCNGLTDTEEPGCDEDGDGYIDINPTLPLCSNIQAETPTGPELIKQVIRDARNFYCASTVSTSSFCEKWETCKDTVPPRSDDCKKFCHRYGC